jgi:D-beta-D-heptose 7-phosphate kinase/D-beta-D-heptose 1-phosphate adenosyltransferase
MHSTTLSPARVKTILKSVNKTKALVVGDIMLDHFIWGEVSRISPEAPVPVVDFKRESFIPGGAANVARNLTALTMPTELFGVTGRDATANHLKNLLTNHGIGCKGMISHADRFTSVKTRIVAHQQQVVRLDRESKSEIGPVSTRRIVKLMESMMKGVSAVIVGDYGKGVVSQMLLEELKALCRERGIWLSLDPKPVHHLDLCGLSLVTPNRKEAFELAKIADTTKNSDPLKDINLIRVVDTLLGELKPAVLLITLGDLGMLLCMAGKKPFHIPTIAQEVFDVSGAGDTVIASFTMAIAAGASPIEAAILSNHAAGIVVGKVGTAVTTPEELIASFEV